MIEVRKKGERIEISFPYNPDHIAKIKAIEGYRWHSEDKCWSVPRSELKGLSALFDEGKLNNLNSMACATYTSSTTCSNPFIMSYLH